MKHTILISDKFDPEGVKRLQNQSDFEVIYTGGCSREEFLKLLPDADGLIIRSATTVDAEAIRKASRLKLIIRAGVGVDNIDIPEASRRGIIVMNSPGGNSVSTAELALSLIFALARHIPQSDASMKAGKWEKSKFLGVELSGKTIGVVGLGRIGREVVRRARSLKMDVIGYDPYLPAESLTSLEIEIVSKEEILKRSDFLTVHVPLTESTQGFINRKNLGEIKKGIRLVNCSRGGIYDEEALEEGLASGQIGGVALDVFTTEPPPENYPLRKFTNCIMTPHLGASTGDAEFAVAMDTVQQMVDFFTKGVANFALNYPSLDPDVMKFLSPYLSGAERVGKLLGALCEGEFKAINLEFSGTIAGYRVEPLVSAILRGALSLSMGDEVNLVNAPYIAKDRGIHISKSENPKAEGYESIVSISFVRDNDATHAASYTVLHNEPVVTSLDKLPIEFKPEGNLIIIENRDVPKVVGMIGMFLGELGINIARLELGRNAPGETARSVITVDGMLKQEHLERLSQLENITRAIQIDPGK